MFSKDSSIIKLKNSNKKYDENNTNIPKTEDISKSNQKYYLIIY